MNRQPFRIAPKLPVNAYRTFGIKLPRRKATCAEIGCRAWQNGWKTILPTDSPAAGYIRAFSGRAFTETRAGDGLAEFTFKPGQTCFAADSHRISLPEAPLASIRGGDWRGQTTPLKRVSLPEWVDRLQDNEGKLAEHRQKG